LVVKGNIRYK